MNATIETILKEILINGLIVGVIGGTLVAFCRENVNVLRTTLLISSARKKLKTGDPKRIRRGVQMLLEVAVARPFRRQEMVDIVIEDCFRRYFHRSRTPPVPTPAPLVTVFVDTLKSILSLPRADENGHSLNVDLRQMRLVRETESEEGSIYLEKMNFAGIELWGCDFVNVDFSRSTFENANIGGTHFRRCGMEFLKLDNVKISYSPLDSRPTIMEECPLAGSNLDKASILPGSPERPQLHIIRSPDIERPVVEWLRQKGVRME
jgi:hypothetical protein